MKFSIMLICLTSFTVLTPSAQALDQTLFEGSVTPFDQTETLPYGSGALIRFKDSKPNDPGYVLTAGHLTLGNENPGTVGSIECMSSKRKFSLYDANGKVVSTLVAEKLIYATRSSNLINADQYATDFALYRLGTDDTYTQIEKNFGVRAFEISADPLKMKDSLTVVSAYNMAQANVTVDSISDKLTNGIITWRRVIQYVVTSGDSPVGGFSGAPLVEANTRTVRGIHSRHESPQIGQAQNIEAIDSIHDQLRCP